MADTLLRLVAVRGETGLSTSTIYRLMDAGASWRRHGPTCCWRGCRRRGRSWCCGAGRAHKQKAPPANRRRFVA